jgi:hypothetical protein
LQIFPDCGIFYESCTSVKLITANFRRADGKALHIRKATRAEPEQMVIYQTLKVNPAPGGISKTIV